MGMLGKTRGEFGDTLTAIGPNILDAGCEMKSTALTQDAFDPNLPTHQLDKLSADRQAQTCPTVFACGR